MHHRYIGSAAGLLLSVAAAALLSLGGGIDAFSPAGASSVFAQPVHSQALTLTGTLLPPAVSVAKPPVALAAASVRSAQGPMKAAAKPSATLAKHKSPAPAPAPAAKRASVQVADHLLHFGDKVASYVQKLRVEVTSYWANPAWSSGYTYTGIKAHPGVIAVDPRVIPLGTYLYVPGYGFGRAEDTGGAIKGKHIDVFFKSSGSVAAWGLKYKTIYILAGAPKPAS